MEDAKVEGSSRHWNGLVGWECFSEPGFMKRVENQENQDPEKGIVEDMGHMIWKKVKIKVK